MRCFRKFRKKLALLLCIALILSLAGCGDDQKYDSRKRVESVFDLFNDPIEPSTQGTTESTTESGGGGDQIVDPPVLDPNKYSDTENEELNEIFKEYFADYVTENSATYNDYISNPADFGIDRPAEINWGSAGTTKDTLERDRKKQQDMIDRLEAIDLNTLTEQQRFDYDYLLDKLKNKMTKFENIYLYSVFTTMRGIQEQIPSYFMDLKFKRKEDLELYIGLIKDCLRLTEESLKMEQDRVDAGYGFEDCVIDEIIKQCDEFVNVTGEHFMITSFNDRISACDWLTDAEKEEWKKKDEDALNTYLIPAYKKIRESFEGWKGKNQVKGGLCNYEDHGSDIYAYLVREATGSSKTPKELISYLNQKQIALKQELQSIYLTDPETYTYYMQNRDTLFDYMNSKTPREYVDYLIENTMDEYPSIGKLEYDISEFDKSMEKIMSSTAAYYMPPQIDDPNGNTIRVNGSSKNERWTTLAHEGCPGHMYQINYFRNTNPKYFRMLSTDLGYIEGWAVYSSYESLKKCDFNGAENASTLARIKAIEEQIGYLAYGRIDLGIHEEGWTVEDVKTYIEGSGLIGSDPEEFYTLLSGNPAVYLSYSVGYFEMQDMRDYAEAQLGSKFNLVKYHKAVLDAGPCQYDQLKKQVDKYILEHK